MEKSNSSLSIGLGGRRTWHNTAGRDRAQEENRHSTFFRIFRRRIWITCVDSLSTPLGLQNRAAIALAAYGAREDEIAACLNIHPAKLEKKFGRQTALGQGLRRVNVLLALHQAADLGRVSAIMLVLRLIEEADRREGGPTGKRQKGTSTTGKCERQHAGVRVAVTSTGAAMLTHAVSARPTCHQGGHLLLGPCARDQLRQSCDHRAAQYDARERVQMPMRRQVPECPTMRALKDTRVVRRDRPPAHVSGEIGAAECSAFRPLLGTGGSRTRSCPRPLQNFGSTRPRLQRFRGYTSSQWVAKTSWAGIGSLLALRNRRRVLSMSAGW